MLVAWREIVPVEVAQPLEVDGETNRSSSVLGPGSNVNVCGRWPRASNATGRPGAALNVRGLLRVDRGDFLSAHRPLLKNGINV